MLPIKPKREENQRLPSHTWNVPTYLGKHKRLSMFAYIATCSYGVFVSEMFERVLVSYYALSGRR